MNYKNINDYEQLYLIKENDDTANEIIFTKYKPIIYSIASKYYNMSNKNGIDIDDLCQEGYIGLANAIKSFKEDVNTCFYTFSIICIERQIKSYYNKYNSNKNRIMNHAYSLDIDIDNSDNMICIDAKEDEYSIHNPFIYLLDSFNNINLINFKHTLSTNESLVFELRYNGFKYKEIATLLGISSSCVDDCIRRIKEKLEKYLNR